MWNKNVKTNLQDMETLVKWQWPLEKYSWRKSLTPKNGYDHKIVFI